MEKKTAKTDDPPTDNAPKKSDLDKLAASAEADTDKTLAAAKEAKPDKPQLALPAPKEHAPKSDPIERKFDFKPRRKSVLFSELSFGQFLITMVIILVLGLGFLGGIYYLVNPTLWRGDPYYAVPVSTAPLSLYLDIDNPEDELLVFDSAVIVTGKTSPNAQVVFSTAENQSAAEANPFGEFSKVFSLTPGMNLIQISAFDDMGNSKTELRRIYFSEEKLKD